MAEPLFIQTYIGHERTREMEQSRGDKQRRRGKEENGKDIGIIYPNFDPCILYRKLVRWFIK